MDQIEVGTMARCWRQELGKIVILFVILKHPVSKIKIPEISNGHGLEKGSIVQMYHPV